MTPADFDPTAVRAQIPMLQDTVYLAACSSAPRSTPLDEAMAAMLDAMGSTDVWTAFEQQSIDARTQFATLIGAASTQIALQPNVSTAAYQIASTLHWHRRPKILTTSAEFPGVAHVWLAQRPYGAQVVFVGDAYGNVTADDYLVNVDADTMLVSIPAATHRDGRRLPVARIAAAAHAAGALVVVDAYQAAGVEPLDVDALGCDFLLAGTMKYLLGLPGVAYLYRRDPTDADRPPPLTGWHGRAQPFALNPYELTYPHDARRYETGTPAVPALYAAVAGLRLINSLDLNAVRQHVRDLIGYAATQLRADGEHLTLPDDPQARGAHLAIDDPHALQMDRWLRVHGIVLAPRHDVARLSVHAYNTRDDIDVACEQLRRYRAANARPAGAPAHAEVQR